MLQTVEVNFEILFSLEAFNHCNCTVVGVKVSIIQKKKIKMTSRLPALIFQELSCLPPYNLHMGLKQGCSGHLTDGCVYYGQVRKCPHVKLVAYLHCYCFYMLHFSFPTKTKYL